MLWKRLTAIAAVFFFLTAFSSLAYADVSSTTAIQTAEQNGIAATNVNGDSLQYIPPPTELQIMPGFYFGYLAYGSPFDPNSNGIDRYIGYNYYGEDMDNIAFPPDSLPDGANFENEDWVYQPWNDQNVKSDFGVINTPEWDGNPQYQDYINAGIFYLNCTTGVGGIGSSTGYTTTDWDGNSLWANLYQYVHILMPPTEYTWGEGRMWHWQDGSLWYVTIPLPAQLLLQQPILYVIPSSQTISVGTTQEFDAIYMYNGQVSKVTASSYWTDDNAAVASIVYDGSGAGMATGLAVGSTNITAKYTSPDTGAVLTGTAALNVQGILVVTPDIATIKTGSTQQYTANYYPNGMAGSSQDVTAQSTWSDDNNSVATIGTNTGLAAGVSAGSTNITATYTPPGGNALNGTAALTVQAQQQQPDGQVSGTLSFTAVSQAGSSRPAGTAEWTDKVTATLTSDAPPQPTATGQDYITGWTWSISNATLNYPTKNPNFTFGYPVDPAAGAMTPTSMTTKSSGTADASFREEWSMDGAGNGRGIYSIIKNPPGIMAVAATPFEITATWTVKSNWTLMVFEGYNKDGDPIYQPYPESQNYTGACTGTLTVDGSGVNSLGNNDNGN